MRALWTTAGVLAGIVVCTPRVRAQDRTAIEEIRQTSPSRLDLNRVAAISSERAAAVTGSNSREDAMAWLDVGALQWQISAATHSSASGGVDFFCESVRAYQKAIAILRRTGGKDDAALLDAELQYAHLMGVERNWYEGYEMWEPIRLAEDVRTAAERIGDRKLAVRAMTVLADIYREQVQRRQNRGIPNYEKAWRLSIWKCPTCPPLKLTQPADDRMQRRARPLLEQAVRMQWVDEVWTRDLIDSLVHLAALHPAGDALAQLAAEGIAALGLPPRDRLVDKLAQVRKIRVAAATPSSDRRIAHDAAYLEAILSTSREASVLAPPPPCDAVRLREAIATQLAGERRMLLALLDEGETEKDFRWIVGTLTPEDGLFDDVVRCGVRDRQVIRNSIERVLLRRQIWRYRLTRVSRARALQDPAMLASLNELVDLRRQRAGQRLMRPSPQPAGADFTEWQVCPENPEAPPSAPMNAYQVLETKITEAEGKLSNASSPAVEHNIQNLWPDLLSSLGTDTVLVGYMPFHAAGDRRVLAFTLDGGGEVAWVDVGREAEIDEQFVTNVSRGLVRDTLRPAGAALIDPIERNLQGKKRVLLLAAGPVRFLPWSALEDSQHRPLGSRYAVSSLHWAGDARPPAAGRPRSAVTFVAPGYEPPPDPAAPWPRIVAPDFAPLDWSAAEVETLSRMVREHGIRTETLRGAEATESAVRRVADPAVLHIAAHGFQVRSAGPLAGDEMEARRELAIRSGDLYPDEASTDLEPSFARTGLAFAGANRLHPPDGGDGLLTASEAADLDLSDTDLVVLSGCDTGFPTLQDGSGAYDLSLAFRMAGASAVVASLWPVDDRASQVLMAALYQGLLDGFPVAEALWRAKEVLRKDPDLGDPRFWAAFEVFGPDFAVWPRAKRRPMAGLLNDSFDEGDPRLPWELAQSSVPAAVQNGRFVIDTRAKTWQFATTPIEIGENDDFDVSVTVAKLEGEDGRFYGLVYRYAAADSFAKFAINGNGEISITSGGGDLSAVLFDSNGPHPAVHRSNATNELRIIGTKDATRFFVNGTEVFEREFRFDLPPRIGFVVNRNLVVAFDDLHVGTPDAPDD